MDILKKVVMMRKLGEKGVALIKGVCARNY